MSRHEKRALASRFKSKKAGMQIVIFRRADGWYPLELPLSDDLAKHAEWNPGTLAIEDIDGNTLWRLQ